jgi:hypothetical protein
MERLGRIVTFRDAVADTPRVSLNPSKGSECCARLPSGGFPGAGTLEPEAE